MEPPVVKRRAGCPLTLSMMRLFHLYRLLPSHCPSLMCIYTLCLQVPQSAMEWMAQCAPVLSRFRLFLGTSVAWSLPGILACLCFLLESCCLVLSDTTFQDSMLPIEKISHVSTWQATLKTQLYFSLLPSTIITFPGPFTVSK